MKLHLMLSNEKEKLYCDDNINNNIIINIFNDVSNGSI